jgi:hypothetical protein
MNRDEIPAGGIVALQTGELMVAARQATAHLPRLTEQTPEGLRSAVAAVRHVIEQAWPSVVPETARDVMVAAARMACDAGIWQVPEAICEALPGMQTMTADAVLELTAEWVDAGEPAPGAGFTPPVAYASSAAFDRDEDEETLVSVAVLLTLAHLALPGGQGMTGPATTTGGDHD